MKVLVINAGSSSLKYQLLDMDKETLLAKGQCERIGMDKAFIKHSANGKKIEEFYDIADHNVAIKLVLDALTSKDHGAISSLDEIDAIGHRVLHGSEMFTKSVIVDDEVIEKLKINIPFGPLHMPANIMGIEACRKAMPGVPNVAVFDTAFHSTMSKEVFLYGLPYEVYTDWKVRKYGFHGTSHKFIRDEVERFTDKKATDLKIISCHLGNGSSICAIKNGKCVDTSMGFTPLEGLIMGTRSGDLDPAVLEYIMNKTGMNISQMTNYLNKKSGLLGITGTSSDMRDLCEKLGKDERADLAMDMLAYRVKKYIGSYVAAMDGVDVIVFTGGIGENTPELREKVLSGLTYLNIKFDNKLNHNNTRGEDIELSTKDSKVRVLRLPTNEEIEIARDTKNLCK